METPPRTLAPPPIRGPLARPRRRGAGALSVAWLAALLAGSAMPATAADLTESAKLAASDGAVGDRLGEAVSISGDTALAGAPSADLPGASDAGAAYAFVRTGSGWAQDAKLVAADGAGGDAFGSAVAVDGDVALVGAPRDDGPPGNDFGSAYVFVRTPAGWTQQARIESPNPAPGEIFGASVALSGGTALVGANWLGIGSAYVFVRSGQSWAAQARLSPIDGAPHDSFGHAPTTGPSVALSGDTALVGALMDDHAGGVNAGAAYVFSRFGSSWSRGPKLVASDAAAEDRFGSSVALRGDTALVGAFNDNTGGGFIPVRSGSAYVFARAGCTWVQAAKLVASDRASLDAFGSSVALGVGSAVVGAVSKGAAYVFDGTGASWSERSRLRGSDAVGGSGFGRSVSLSTGTAVVGATGGFPGPVQGGAAYTYDGASPVPLDATPSAGDAVCGGLP